MVFEFALPDVGEGVAEGEIVAWHVEPGDSVAEDEVLAEVETDKAIVDLPSPVAGTVVELRAEVGDVVPVGDVVVTIEADGEPTESGGEAEPAVDEPEPAETDQGDDGAEDGTGGRVFAPPNVRRLARELGVDVASVNGSGPGGRVTEGDVRAVAEGSTDGADTVAAGDGSEPEPAGKVGTDRTSDGDRDRTLAAPATRRVAREEGVDIDAVPTDKTRDGEPFVEPEDVRAYAEVQQLAQQTEAGAVATDSETAAGEPRTDDAEATAATGTAAADGEVTRKPYRGVRRTIGEHMEESVYSAPHVTHHDTAVVDELVETRADLKPRASERGVTLTYLPFVMKAVVAGLKEYPVLNTTLDEDEGEVIYKHFYDLGVAVATDAGLMVPVVEDVEEKSVLQLAAEASELAKRARDRNLAREEMQGGTFSITNFGAIGGEYATPIINYPETAILGLGSIEQRPVVADGEVVPAHTLPLSLSIDHRVIDGAEAASFVNTVIEYLENPRLLLLE